MDCRTHRDDVSPPTASRSTHFNPCFSSTIHPIQGLSTKRCVYIALRFLPCKSGDLLSPCWGTPHSVQQGGPRSHVYTQMTSGNFTLVKWLQSTRVNRSRLN